MITVERSAEKIMYDDAVKAFPDECCGFMYGHEDAGNRVVTQALPINNAAVENRKRRFEIAPKDYMKGERHAVENDLRTVGNISFSSQSSGNTIGARPCGGAAIFFICDHFNRK